jgi:hypothetical protein
MSNFTPIPHSKLEEALNHAAELLQCAAATAYESGDRLSGTDRHLAMSVMYLVDMAKTVIDQSLSGLEAGTAGQ